MGGIFEKLDIRRQLLALSQFFKSSLGLSWIALILAWCGIYLISLFLSFTPPISQSVTVAFDKKPDVIKVSTNHELPAPDPAYEKYAQPYTVVDGAPVAAVVITDLGLDSNNLKLARDLFPKEVTFALSPETPNLQQTIQDLRAEGREVLMMIPMEPLNYPQSDPGPNALLTSLNPEDNITRVREYLKDTQGIVGITNFMGEAFTRSVEHVRPFLKYVKSQGYLVLDTTLPERSEISPLASELHMTPTIIKDQSMGDLSSSKDKEAAFSNLERLSKRDMKVIAVHTSYPNDMREISDWSKSLKEKGITLVPLTFAQTYTAIQNKPEPHESSKNH